MRERLRVCVWREVEGEVGSEWRGRERLRVWRVAA